MERGECILKRKDGYREAQSLISYELSGYEPSGKIWDKYKGEKNPKDARDARAATVPRGSKASRSAKEKAWAKAFFGKNMPAVFALNADANAKPPFWFFCEEWLKSNRPKIKESTYVKYETVLKKHIKPYLGSYDPLSLNDTLVETFSNELLFDEELAPKTVKDILVVLRSILNYTAKQFVDGFPSIEIRYPKTTKKETRVLTEEEQTRFIRYLLTDMDECKFGTLLSLLTGMRIGEICALQWQNISLKNNTIRISATMQRLRDTDTKSVTKTRIIIGSPKSDASLRTIPMSDSVVKICRKMQPENAAAFVLTGTQYYMEPRALQYRMERYTEDCGLEDVHFHTLRHTFTTRCVEAGFEIKSLSEILGHANTTVTLDCYMHASLELKRNNMNKLSVAGL